MKGPPLGAESAKQPQKASPRVRIDVLHEKLEAVLGTRFLIGNESKEKSPGVGWKRRMNAVRRARSVVKKLRCKAKWSGHNGLQKDGMEHPTFVVALMLLKIQT